MSFETLNHDQLVEAAELFAVDLATSMNTKGKVNPKLAAAAFAEDGVTFDMYTELKAQHERARAELAAKEAEEAALEAQRAANVVTAATTQADEDLEPVEDEVVITRRRTKPRSNDILVKMNRQNSYFEIAGKVFTREHPFVLCTEEEAQAIFDAEWGFHVATPREAAEYYS